MIITFCDFEYTLSNLIKTHAIGNKKVLVLVRRTRSRVVLGLAMPPPFSEFVQQCIWHQQSLVMDQNQAECIETLERVLGTEAARF